MKSPARWFRRDREPASPAEELGDDLHYFAESQDQYLLHWGSRSSRRGVRPRISLGIYFQSGDVPPFDPLARELTGSLTFEQRLSYISRALLRYDSHFPLPVPLKSFALWTRDQPGL